MPESVPGYCYTVGGSERTCGHPPTRVLGLTHLSCCILTFLVVLYPLLFSLFPRFLTPPAANGSTSDLVLKTLGFNFTSSPRSSSFFNGTDTSFPSPLHHFSDHSESITINFSILHHHTDGAAIYGFFSGLAILYETNVEMAKRNISFDCVLHLTDLYSPDGRSSKTNIYTMFSVESWQQLGARIGCTILTISKPISTAPVPDLLCVKNGITWDKNSFRSGVQSLWHSCPLRPDRPFNGGIYSFLDEIPNRLADYVSCATIRNLRNINILLYTKGTATGTSIFHAYAYYSINLTRPKPYTGLLSVRHTSDHKEIYSAVSTCIFFFDSGRCRQVRPQILSEILRNMTGFVSGITGINTIKCVVVKEFRGLFNYTNGERHEILSNQTAGFDNRALMSFAESSKVFVVDIGSHWSDHILALRSTRDLPSLILDCHDRRFSNLITVIPDSVTWIPYWKKNECRNAVFRRGHCVTSKASWMIDETFQPGICPLSRHGNGDGYH